MRKLKPSKILKMINRYLEKIMANNSRSLSKSMWEELENRPRLKGNRHKLNEPKLGSKL